MLVPKQAVRTVSRANPPRWNDLMNKKISVIFLLQNGDFLFFFYVVHVSSSKSVICLWAKRSHVSPYLAHRPLSREAKCLFIISVWDTSCQNLLKLITLCGKHCVVSYINSAENPDQRVCPCVVNNQSAWWEKVTCLLRQSHSTPVLHP